jgi:hypothetical protein
LPLVKLLQDIFAREIVVTLAAVATALALVACALAGGTRIRLRVQWRRPGVLAPAAGHAVWQPGYCLEGNEAQRSDAARRGRILRVTAGQLPRGSGVPPLVLGPRARRREIVLRSVGGAAVATAAAVVLGAFAGWLSWEVAPRSLVFVWIALGLGVPAGIGGGWLASRIAN